MKYLKKIKKETVEEFLEVTLSPNKIAIGFDVSMHSTGIAIIRTTETYVIVEEVSKITTPKKVIALDSLDLFIEQLNNFALRISRTFKVDISVIEDCFFGQCVRTLKALARHSVLVYDRFKGISRKSVFMLPTSARSKVNFKKSSKKIKGVHLKKEIVNYINKALDIKLKETKDQDIADALVLALAGLIEDNS